MNKREVIYYDVSPFAAVSAKTTLPNNAQGFSSVQKLFRENMVYRSIQTCEHNYTILDGTHDSFAPDENIALWGMELSLNPSRLLPNVVTLDITFGGLQSSPGIAFYFDTQNNGYCDMLNVKWYSNTTLLSDKTFYPDSPVYSCHNKVELYNRVRIDFMRLNMPRRYLKIEAVLFGIVRVFGEDSLENLTVNEGLDPTGRTVHINSASFTINTYRPTDGGDPIPYIFLKRQPLHIKYGGARIGTYYIDKSKKYADRRYSVEAIDKIGVLDATDEFLGGIYQNVQAETVINEIVGGLFDVEVDDSLRGVPVSGWIPILKKREALAQVALAIGAIVDATRTDAVKIRAIPTAVSKIIGKDRVYQSSAVAIEFPYTGVEVIEHSFTPGAVKELHKDIFSGTKTVKFSEPTSNLTIVNGSVVGYGANYARITGGTLETVLSGKVYADNQSSVIVKSGPNIEGT